MFGPKTLIILHIKAPILSTILRLTVIRIEPFKRNPLKEP